MFQRFSHLYLTFLALWALLFGCACLGLIFLYEGFYVWGDLWGAIAILPQLLVILVLFSLVPSGVTAWAYVRAETQGEADGFRTPIKIALAFSAIMVTWMLVTTPAWKSFGGDTLASSLFIGILFAIPTIGSWRLVQLRSRRT